jgi:adenylate cyclase
MTDEIHFGRFCLDLAQGGLLRDGKPVPLGNRALEILVVLASAKGEIVTKDELMARVWPGRVVEENNIQVHVSALRKALDEGSNTGSCVMTVPGRGYRLVGTPWRVSVDQAAAVPVSKATERPSIAIIAFQNMSDDPDQDHFTDGIVEEIITGLSRFQGLTVVARNSSFAYRGRAIDVRQIGRELGVRYVLEGSVRKAAGKVRIIGQLIDAATGMHLWADRFEGDLADVFALQDEVMMDVVSAIAPKMFQIEIDLATRRPNDLSAYDLCLRALSHFHSWTRGGSAEARRLASRALEIDPRYGWAAILAGNCHLLNVRQGWAADPSSEIAEGMRLLRLALSIDGNDPLALSILGRETAFWSGDFDTAREMADRAVACSPNLSRAWSERGWTYQIAGQPEEAIRSFERAIRLSPFDPFLFVRLAGMSAALIDLGRFDEAVATAKKAVLMNQRHAIAYRCLAVALAHLGREAEARETVARLLELEPNFRISEWTVGRWQSQASIDGLRKAGFPE